MLDWSNLYFLSWKERRKVRLARLAKPTSGLAGAAWASESGQREEEEQVATGSWGRELLYEKTGSD